MSRREQERAQHGAGQVRHIDGPLYRRAAVPLLEGAVIVSVAAVVGSSAARPASATTTQRRRLLTVGIDESIALGVGAKQPLAGHLPAECIPFAPQLRSVSLRVHAVRCAHLFVASATLLPAAQITHSDFVD